jgi:hypothetical protein
MMKKTACRFWFQCPTPCLTRKPKTNSVEISRSIGKPSYFCRMYHTKLTPLREEKGSKIFVDKNGKTHSCVKIKNGKLWVCRRLEG